MTKYMASAGAIIAANGAKLIKDARGYRACNAAGICRTYKTHLRAWKWAFGK